MAADPSRARGTLEGILERLEQLETNKPDSTIVPPTAAEDSTIDLDRVEPPVDLSVDSHRIRVSEIVPSLGLRAPKDATPSGRRIVGSYATGRRRIGRWAG